LLREKQVECALLARRRRHHQSDTAERKRRLDRTLVVLRLRVPIAMAPGQCNHAVGIDRTGNAIRLTGEAQS
jgi:hypothetical protein